MEIRIPNRLKKYLIYIPVILTSLMMLVPVIWLLLSSIQRTVDIMHIPPFLFPPSPTLKNFTDVLVGVGGRATFRDSFLNSLIISSATTVICVLLGSTAGYAFSRGSFRYKNSVFILLLITQMIPEVAIVIPLYYLYSQINLLDTIIGMVLLNSAILLPYTSWLMRGFFDSLSPDFEEAAMIDGCSKLESIFRIAMPLAAPGMAAVAIFSFIESWNEFFYAFILTNVNATTVQVAIGSYMGKATYKVTNIFASATLSLIPIIIFAIVFRNYLMKGLTEGGLKF